MHEDVAKAAETADFFDERCREDVFTPEAREDLLVGLGRPPEGTRQQMIPDVQHDLTAELQAPLGQPLRVLVVAELRQRDRLQLPQAADHVLEPPKPCLDGRSLERHDSSSKKYSRCTRRRYSVSR